MTAVFGKPYDGFENRERIELFEKDFAKCTGDERRTPARSNDFPFHVGRLPLDDSHTSLPHEYLQEFQQYRELLQEAFQGRPGRFEPAVVTQHVLQVRHQLMWANTAMSSAAQVSANTAGFDQLGERQLQIAHEMDLLAPEQREQVRHYLLTTQRKLGFVLVQHWLAGAEQRNPASEGAATLKVERQSLNEEITLLDASDRATVGGDYERLLGRDLTPAMQAEAMKLGAFPASWKGAQALGGWESEFLDRFGEFTGSTPFHSVVLQFQSARARIYSSALASWQKNVNSAPGTLAGLAAYREELDRLFPTDADRVSPLHAEFEEPINARQAQIQSKLDADERRRLTQAEAAAAAEEARTTSSTQNSRSQPDRSNIARPVVKTAAGDLSEASLKIDGDPDDNLFRHLYLGEFDKIQIDRSSPDLSALNHAAAHDPHGIIAPANAYSFDQLAISTNGTIPADLHPA